MFPVSKWLWKTLGLKNWLIGWLFKQDSSFSLSSSFAGCLHMEQTGDNSVRS